MLAALMHTGMVPSTSLLSLDFVQTPVSPRGPPPVLGRALPGSTLCPVAAILAHASHPDYQSGTLLAHLSIGSLL